jgi:MFS family permease
MLPALILGSLNESMWPALAAMQFSERSWLAALILSRAFIALIFMTYAASLPTLTHEWSMTATQAGFVQTCFSAGFAISLFVTSWLSDHIGAKRMFFWSCWLGAAAALAFALLARSYEQALWLYGLVGLTQGGSYTPAIMLAAQQLPRHAAVRVSVGCWQACRRAMSDRSVWPRG